MSDHSLMNPEYLKSEIADLTTKLIPETEKLADELKEDYERILGYLRATHNKGENTTLTHEQVHDLVGVLTKFNMNTWRYSNSHKFSVRIYENLLKDRRWIIGSKLRFLKK